MITEKRIEKTVKKGSSNIPIQWDLSDVEMDFAKKKDGSVAIFGCGCSSFKDEGKIIKGSYNPIITEDVNKSFTIFFDDGEPLELKNNKGVLVKNTKGKKHLVLTFKLIVQV